MEAAISASPPLDPSYDPCKIFVGGCNETLISERDLWEYFGAFGDVEGVHQREGCSFITMASATSVTAACATRWPKIASHTVEVKRAKRAKYHRSPMPPSPSYGLAHELMVQGLGGGVDDEMLLVHFVEMGVDVVECGVLKKASSIDARDGEGAVLCRSEDDVARATSDSGRHELAGFPFSVRRADPTDTNWSKLFVGGLEPSTDSPDLREFFSQYGYVRDACVMFNKPMQRSRGFGFVTFSCFSEARAALNDQPLKIKGKEIEIKYSKPKEKAKHLMPYQQEQLHNGGGGYPAVAQQNPFVNPYSGAFNPDSNNSGMGGGPGNGNNGGGGGGGGMHGPANPSASPYTPLDSSSLNTSYGVAPLPEQNSSRSPFVPSGIGGGGGGLWGNQDVGGGVGSVPVPNASSGQASTDSLLKELEAAKAEAGSLRQENLAIRQENMAIRNWNLAIKKENESLRQQIWGRTGYH